MRPGRLFHAVVLVGAAFGAGSCRRPLVNDGTVQLSDGGTSDGRSMDGGAAADLRLDYGFDQASEQGVDQASDARDATGDERFDAGCQVDLDCGGWGLTADCRCVVGIA